MYNKPFKLDIKKIVCEIAPEIILPTPKELERGGIVGCVEIVDCVTRHNSPWFFGPCGFVLQNPYPLKFTPWRGQLGFFEVPAMI